MTNNSPLTKGRVEMNVKAGYAEQRNCLITSVSMETIIEPEEIKSILSKLSIIFDRQITLKRGKPKRGWRISTLVGYIYDHQDEFPLPS
ncbi:MAG: hypothetical protein UW71_C0008G0012 [Parcubacteria group bacterium GW2011_GWB1_44_7]|nr:MAG: hypothetical protein UW71_C0008G0012 [Parcubacteria group bacterium GW2011_GWB1_44_7]